jgi:hypothetical protein
LAALKEINNIFIIEILSSDSKENIPNSLNYKNNNINEFKENFNEMHLSNFELFVKILIIY